MNNQVGIPLCAICGSTLVIKRIDYIDSNDGQFLIIKNVPVQECEESGHQFMDAATAKEIEKMFALDRDHLLKPEKLISVPVVELNLAI
jgi:YgiT-type zinc finger domain-containing protein